MYDGYVLHDHHYAMLTVSTASNLGAPPPPSPSSSHTHDHGQSKLSEELIPVSPSYNRMTDTGTNSDEILPPIPASDIKDDHSRIDRTTMAIPTIHAEDEQVWQLQWKIYDLNDEFRDGLLLTSTTDTTF